MSPQPPDGSAEDGLCCSLLRFANEPEQVEQLRQVLGGFNHRCRNLLNGMKMSLYLVKRSAPQPLPERWREVEHTYQTIERLFDRLQTIYRPMNLTTIEATFRSFVESRQSVWRDWFDARGVNLVIRAPDREEIGEFDPMCLTQAWDAFVSWRAALANPGAQCLLGWGTGESAFDISWQEGAGASPSSPAAHPSTSPRRPTTEQTIDSLSLPLLSRVAAAHRGRLEWAFEPDFRVKMRWPLRQPVAAQLAHV